VRSRSYARKTHCSDCCETNKTHITKVACELEHAFLPKKKTRLQHDMFNFICLANSVYHNKSISSTMHSLRRVCFVHCRTKQRGFSRGPGSD